MSAETTARGEWLRIEKLIYEDFQGREKSWESVVRNKAKGAVVILATLKPSGKIVLVSQFRPPAGGRVLEFPAGLLDRDESIEIAALRELKEECGFVGRVVETRNPSFSSPGMSGESITMALVEIDETLPANLSPVCEPDESECIETHLVLPEQIASFIGEQEDLGVMTDSKVLSFALGIQFKMTCGL